MSRILIAVVLGTLLAVAPPPPQNKDKAKDRPRDRGTPGEKIDASVNRELAGVIEKVEATGENSGALKMRSSGPARERIYHYTFHVDGRTKILTSKARPLKDGLKSARLARGAEVLVQFDDRPPGKVKPSPPGKHFALRIQLIEPTRK
jgi:hypothetical protein